VSGVILLGENVKKDNQTGKPVSEIDRWSRRLGIVVAIWGIVSLLFSSILFGIIFILFAIVIYFTKSVLAIYAVGIVLIILALLQLLQAAGFSLFSVSAAQGNGELILVAILNLVIGLIIMYRAYKL
jgi:hypothetical protein